MTETHALRCVLILADQSADWIIAGLRQLDRLALSLNEFGVRNRQSEPIVVCIFWSPSLDQAQRWLPGNRRLTKVAFTSDFERRSFDLILSTRLFLYRDAVPQLIETSSSPPKVISQQGEQELWEIYSQQLRLLSHSRPGRWKYITESREIDEIGKKFLRGSGKSQDGLVSRYLNRPISRSLTRCLLRFAITPNAWTLLIFPIPIVGSLILLHGTYWSLLWGLVLFQVFSVLDGCDGEIARAKFLESGSGRRLDDLCDILGNILLVVGLGFGLSRQANLAGHSGLFYVIEALVAAVLIGINEFLLATRKSGEGVATSVLLGKALYPRHRELVERSGILLLGEKFAYWVIQLTKRDVALLGFLFLAAIGQSAWILHLLCAVTALSLALSTKTFANRSVP